MDGIQFAIVKCTEGSADGTAFFDPQFINNINGANSNSISTHAYHYFLAISETDARNEADWFIENVVKADVRGYLFVDVEDSSLTTNVTNLTNYVNAFLDELVINGYTKIGVYASYSFFNDRLNESDLRSGILKWVARYNDTLGRTADIWQNSSSGSVSGISGNVDTDIGYNSVIINSTPPPTNHPPTVSNYSVSTIYHTQVSGTCIGSDSDGDTLTYSKYSSPTHGSAMVSSNGSWSYTPSNNYLGLDSFKIKVSDGNGGYAYSTISITINPPIVTIPSPPSLKNVSYLQYLTIMSSVPIYVSPNTSSGVVISITNIYSIVYLEDGTSNNGFGYVKYSDNQNITYYGFIELSKIATQDEIDQSPPIDTSVYDTVIDGDTLESIAQRNNTTVSSLKLLNGMRNSVLISVGDQIRVK